MCMHGYAIMGHRCYGVLGWYAKERTNVVGALIGENLHATGLFWTSINADVFRAWLAQDLLPRLSSSVRHCNGNVTFKVSGYPGYHCQSRARARIPICLLSRPQPLRTQMSTIKSPAQKISMLYRELFQ